MLGSEWSDDFPYEWTDIGKRVEIEFADGSRIVGTAQYDDMTPGPDEAPLLYLVDSDGQKVPRDVYDGVRWRERA